MLGLLLGVEVGCCDLVCMLVRCACFGVWWGVVFLIFRACCVALASFMLLLGLCFVSVVLLFVDLLIGFVAMSTFFVTTRLF